MHCIEIILYNSMILPISYLLIAITSTMYSGIRLQLSSCLFFIHEHKGMQSMFFSRCKNYSHVLLCNCPVYINLWEQKNMTSCTGLSSCISHFPCWLNLILINYCHSSICYRKNYNYTYQASSGPFSRKCFLRPLFRYLSNAKNLNGESKFLPVSLRGLQPVHIWIHGDG